MTAPGEHQLWTLQDDARMTRDGHPSAPGEVTTIAGGTTSWWCADEQAILDYDIRQLNAFSVRIQLLQVNGLQLMVGKCSADRTTFVPCASEPAFNTDPSLQPDLLLHDLEHARAITVTRPFAPSMAQGGDSCIVQACSRAASSLACSVDDGEYLAVGVRAVDGQARIGHHVIPAGIRPAIPDSRLDTAFTPASYPTPELGTLALTLVGLTALVLYVRRR